MSDKQPAWVQPGGLSASHVYPSPSDRKPVFMYGLFDPGRARSAAVRARHAARPGSGSGDGSMVIARRTGSRSHAEVATIGTSAFMFGVHPD